MSGYKKLANLTPVLFLVFSTLWLRLVNLGYSDYYGDEIKAMWLPAPGQNAIDYLYNQKKGPTEFLVSFLVKLIDPTYSNEFIIRLPFALAGIIAIYFLYRVVEINFNKKIALYSTMLLSANGIFIGLMRFVQYQPFVILFSVLTLCCFSLALQPKWSKSGIYLGVLFWTAGFLSHYDAIFISPFALYLLLNWYKKNTDQPPLLRVRHMIIPFALGGLILAIYFVPYLISIPSGTTNYWMLRLTGQGDATGMLRSSIANFDLYNPILGLPFYFILGILALIKIKKIFSLLIWFIFPWIILEGFIFDPGTHINNYLIPGVIIVAFGLEVIEEFTLRVVGELWGRRINLIWLALLFGSLACISHLIFVDHTPEYPYEKRRILLWTIGGGSTDTMLWPYGFPYYRRWEDLGKYVISNEGNGYYYTNEQTPISKYYVPLDHSAKNAGYYIYIHNPQSFLRREQSLKAYYWRTHYEPVKIFKYNNRLVAEIYSMPAGGLGDIKEAGY